ncbi:Crp/Fnr family transcriptional regulator FnrL [Alteraurantiacibacter aestuarii]|uniref:Helix-turn-helix domain-containing protein n=1 Tax=Alteraurantiacibacter aestuarii TaxID=650004 RepID=A0A844ZJH4_9SPHN|nr:Crp/Fnr family transcriptional regulator [Alteraurantiacibacter aestuarii]MXO87928.1 helix-turn-helix domain-containing protein [Alteraurantiacibacter aestuarii]
MNLACETCPVRDRAACAVLNDGARDDLARSGRTRKLRRGDILFSRGEEDAACAMLVSGALKIATFDTEGNEHILALVHPSGFIGELFAPFATYDVVALTDSELCVFPRSEMLQALDENPKLAKALLRRTEEELRRSRKLLELSGRSSAIGRVASLIRGMADAASKTSCHMAQKFDLPLTRGEMANMLGLTIETVSRSLTRLEREGILRRNGVRGIELIDPAQLGLMG